MKVSEVGTLSKEVTCDACTDELVLVLGLPPIAVLYLLEGCAGERVDDGDSLCLDG